MIKEERKVIFKYSALASIVILIMFFIYFGVLGGWDSPELKRYYPGFNSAFITASLVFFFELFSTRTRNAIRFVANTSAVIAAISAVTLIYNPYGHVTTDILLAFLISISIILIIARIIQISRTRQFFCSVVLIEIAVIYGIICQIIY